MFPRHFQHLADVARTAPASGQVPVYNATTGLWEPMTIRRDIIQAADETRASNTFADANTLQLSGLVAGVSMDFEMRLVFLGAATCGIKMMLIDNDSVLDTGSVVEMLIGTGTTHRSASGDIASSNVALSHSTQLSGTAWLSGRLRPLASGQAYFQWAQVTTNAGNPMSMLAGSRLVMRRTIA